MSLFNHRVKAKGRIGSYVSTGDEGLAFMQSDKRGDTWRVRWDFDGRACWARASELEDLGLAAPTSTEGE